MSLRAATQADFAAFHGATGFRLSAEATGIVATDMRGLRRGLVAFDAWTPASAHAHVWLEAPYAARRLLPAACRYVFEDCGRRVVLGVIRESHRRSRAVAVRMGFREVARVADGWAPDEALVLYQLRREDCRFVEETS